jgi:hypothetical protein
MKRVVTAGMAVFALTTVLFAQHPNEARGLPPIMFTASMMWIR